MTPEILILGIPVSGAVYWFCCRFLGYRMDYDRAIFKVIPLIMKYAGIAVWEVVKANVEVIRIVLSPRMNIDPVIFYFKTDLKTAGARTALANTITLTPGTITVSIVEDMLCIHALKREMAESLPIWHMIRILHQIEDTALKASGSGVIIEKKEEAGGKE
ncbi:Na+/H+ antiporter subunit E [Clostridium sp. AM58-1XD]|uniref:Na+/H+ antiporter subunit E n=1 Tax=Clostridium sp. AM58-1XD TaxID=2292307 RepID=UPI00325AD505